MPPSVGVAWYLEHASIVRCVFELWVDSQIAVAIDHGSNLFAFRSGSGNEGIAEQSQEDQSCKRSVSFPGLYVSFHYA